MTSPQDELNKKHIETPEPGDYWHERMVPYHLVLAVLENGNIVIAESGDYSGIRLDRCREVTKAEQNKLVCYHGHTQAFCADVLVGSENGLKGVDVWKMHYRGDYTSIDESKVSKESPVGVSVEIIGPTPRIDPMIPNVITGRYIQMLGSRGFEPVQNEDPDQFTCPDSFDGNHLLWMLIKIRKGELSDVGKANRWLAFVQTVIIFKGWTTIKEERDFTRPYFNNTN
jgi:hypothetical protein